MKRPPWDPRIANDAIVIEQCLKLGGRVLERPRPSGFSEHVVAVQRVEHEQQGQQRVAGAHEAS